MSDQKLKTAAVRCEKAGEMSMQHLEIIRLKSFLLNYLPETILRAISNKRYVHALGANRLLYREGIVGKRGLEIGGPSSVFRDVLKLYESVGALDCVNFAESTIWEGKLADGDPFEYANGRSGRQYIRDAVDLSDIGTDFYDFIISSNCLEHIANPLRALAEWKRVVKGKGQMLLVLPNKRENFDHRREITSIEHLVTDQRNGTTEDDLTHLDEILRLHDLSLDIHSAGREEFERRCRNNYRFRGMHHHVFDVNLVREMFLLLDIEYINSTETYKDIFVIGVVNK